MVGSCVAKLRGVLAVIELSEVHIIRPVTIHVHIGDKDNFTERAPLTNFRVRVFTKKEFTEKRTS